MNSQKNATHLNAIFRILCLSLFFSFFITHISAITITVCPSGCDHTTIQAAVDAAAASGDVIDIQSGTFTEADIDISMKDLTIQGQGQSNTIIQAAATQVAATDEVFHIIHSSVAFLDLTIQNGNADPNAGLSTENNGGALFISFNTPTTISFTRVTITNNTSLGGGAIYATGDNGILLFTDCLLTNNSTVPTNTLDGGGAVQNLGADVFTMIRCTVTGNHSGHHGGALLLKKTDGINKLINCTFANNTAGGGNFSNIEGGAMDFEFGVSFDIINCTIVDNSLITSSTREGGRILWSGGDLNILNSIIANNSGASDASRGDDIYSEHSGTFTQTKSIVEDCDKFFTSTDCPTWFSTNDPNLTAITTCGIQSYYAPQSPSDALDNGEAPSGDIPTNDICQATRQSPHDIGAYDVSGIPLPVELIDFKARLENGEVVLSWQTAFEHNNLGFEIEHSSNGLEWQTAEFISGKGNNTLIQDYFFKHQNPVTGLNYYRLKQMDYDGRIEFSEVVSIKVMQEGYENEVLIYPNPTTGVFEINYDSFERSNYSIRDGYGKMLRKGSFYDGQILDISNLPNGIYLMSIFEERRVMTKRIVKF